MPDPSNLPSVVGARSLSRTSGQARESAFLNSEEIERRLVGGVLRFPDKVHEIRDIVRPEDFADALMRDIWTVIDELAIEGVAIDRAIVSRRTPAPPNVTLPVLLAKLQAEAGAEEKSVNDYAKEFSDAVMRRRARGLFEHGVEIMAKAPNARAALSGMQGEISEILGASRREETHIGQIAKKIIDAAGSGRERPSLLYAGLPFIDDIVGPLRPANLIVCGGATSSGKSAIAGQIAHSIAKRSLVEDRDNPGQRLGCPVLYITMEMSDEEVIERMLSWETGLTVENIESGNLQTSEYHALNEARRTLDQLPIYIEDIPRATAATILALVMKYQKTKGIGLVIIDHLHYLRGANRKADRFGQIEEVVIDLKAGAKQTKIPWLAISHLNARDIGKRQDKRPHLGDLYGASEIEKSGDVVFFVHRPQYWMDRETAPESGPKRDEWNTEYAKWLDRAEIIVEKRRKGRGVASRKCGFDARLTLFHTI